MGVGSSRQIGSDCSSVLFTFVVLASVVAWWLNSPEMSGLVVAVVGKFSPMLDSTVHFDGMSLLRSQIDLLQNFTSQLVARGDLVGAEVGPRNVPAGFRIKCLFAFATTGISVIVPTLNEEKYLRRCLMSLANQAWDGTFEILVIDGGSSDKTLQIAERYADRVLVKSKAPVGAARNLGAKAASGDILAFIDADTIANPHWLEAIDASFRQDLGAVGLTGPTLPYDGCLSDSITYRLWTIYLQRLLLYLQMPHVIGFNCAYRRVPFLSVGGFDEDNVMSEDIKLAHKIRKYGNIRFQSEMSALTSARRFRRYGRLYIGGLYLMNGFSTLLLDWSASNYPPVR